jgi:hypothetical protein
MNNVLQEYIPGQVGRYDDAFEPRAFGDNIQKWGTSTILIESGGFPNDPEKQEIRKLNYTIILASLFAISNKTFLENEISSYENIPENDRMLIDLKILGINYNLLGKNYILDLGINQEEVDLPENNSLYYNSKIVDRGDLSTSFGYEEFDAKGYNFVSPGISSRVYSMAEVKEMDFYSLLKEGYAYIKVRDLPTDKDYVEYPINLAAESFKLPKGITSNFFLEKNGILEYAVINGFLMNLNNKDLAIKNSLILK